MLKEQLIHVLTCVYVHTRFTQGEILSITGRKLNDSCTATAGITSWQQHIQTPFSLHVGRSYILWQGCMLGFALCLVTRTGRPRQFLGGTQVVPLQWAAPQQASPRLCLRLLKCAQASCHSSPQAGKPASSALGIQPHSWIAQTLFKYSVTQV